METPKSDFKQLRIKSVTNSGHKAVTYATSLTVNGQPLVEVITYVLYEITSPELARVVAMGRGRIKRTTANYTVIVKGIIYKRETFEKIAQILNQ
jgi:hypothetical protein